MNSLTEAAASIALAVIGIAILAVIVSKNSNTSGVLGAAGTAFSQIIGAAVSPVTGSGYSLGSY